jgi:ATP/maltotriose-dependent transcriptional regulator MalT
MMFLQMGQVEQAVAILKEVDAESLDQVEKTASRQQDRKALVLYCGLALVAKAKGDRDRALALTIQHEQLARKLGLPSEVAIALGNRANIHAENGAYDDALQLHHRKEEVARELRDPTTLAIALINQGLLLSRELSRPEEGLPKAVEAYQIVVGHGLTHLQHRMGRTIEMLLNAALDHAVKLIRRDDSRFEADKSGKTGRRESHEARRRRGLDLLKQMEAAAEDMNQPRVAELARKARKSSR